MRSSIDPKQHKLLHDFGKNIIKPMLPISRPSTQYIESIDFVTKKEKFARNTRLNLVAHKVLDFNDKKLKVKKKKKK